MRYVLNILYLLGLVLSLPFFLYKMATAGKYRRGMAQRFGKIARRSSQKPLIWIHAVSVGEIKLAEPLVKALEEKYPEYELAITHTTKTGEEVAAKLYPNLLRSYSPIDLSWVVAKFFRRLKPALIILVELELWPNFLLHAARSEVPVVLVNGRISQRSAMGYGRHQWFFRSAFKAISAAGVQNPEYQSRLRGLLKDMRLSREVVRVCGNMKYESVATERDMETRDFYRKLFGVTNDELLLVCGSTHPGEHEHLPDIYKNLRSAKLPLRVVVVPRHPERWSAVRQSFAKATVALLNRSELEGDSATQTPSEQSKWPPCFLLDTMGELSKLYHAADLVFVGGSLIPHGGQNMVEPAGIGLPVLFGPHTFNFKDTVRDLLKASAAIEVKDFKELQDSLQKLCENSQERIDLGTRAQEVIQAGRGSVDKHMQLLQGFLKPNTDIKDHEEQKSA